MNDLSSSSGLHPDAPSLVGRALRVLKREPILFVTLGYLFVAFIGLWANYWFYSRFGLPVLEYMQGADFLVAGLREPAYALALGAAVVFTFVVTWPERWRRRNPERALQLRAHWWGRLLFRSGEPRRFAGLGMAPESALVFGVLWATIWLLFGYVISKAQDIQAGGGHVVRVTLSGQPAAMPGTPRLLGTSSAFVFLYWIDGKRAEAMPIEAIARIESLRLAAPAPAAPAKAASPQR